MSTREPVLIISSTTLMHLFSNEMCRRFQLLLFPIYICALINQEAYKIKVPISVGIATVQYSDNNSDNV